MHTTWRDHLVYTPHFSCYFNKNQEGKIQAETREPHVDFVCLTLDNMVVFVDEQLSNDREE